MIRSVQYSDNCCLTLPSPKVEEAQSSQPATNERWSESSGSDDGPMKYGTLRPFKTCTLKWRKSEGGSNPCTYSEYKCLQHFPRGGKVEIGQTIGEDAWATTRWVRAVSDSHNEAKQCDQCMSPIVPLWTVR